MEESEMHNQESATKTIDPVCHMEIPIKGKTLKRVHKQKAYYFCSLHCKTQFDTAPEYYASKSGKAAQ